MFELNQMQNNTVLRLEFTTQAHGESFWVEYDDFLLTMVEFDNITYSMPYNLLDDYKRNQYEAYPITNLGKMTSSLKNGSFIFILPSFYEESLKRERTAKEKFIFIKIS